MEDRRIQKSKEAIQKSFLALLQEKNLKKITVAEICRMANIGRGTFYLHYMDVYDLYEQIEGELYAGLLRLYSSAFPTTHQENSKLLSDGLTLYIEEHKALFLLLVRADNDHAMQKLKSLFNEQVLQESRKVNPDGNPAYDTMEAIFVVAGVVGVLEQWLTDGMQIPRGEVAAMLNRILCKINRSCL